MGKFDGLPVVLVVAALLACGGAAPKPVVATDSNQVEVGKGDPPPGYVQLQTLEVQHGSGCGMYGHEGNFDGAYALLRDEGYKIGADYVQIMTVREPYSDGSCLHREYKMTGVAYRKGEPLAGSAPRPEGWSATAATTPSASAPPRACVPGATQACLGPGACNGAQACRDDGSGFNACDCGSPAQAAVTAPSASAAAATPAPNQPAAKAPAR